MQDRINCSGRRARRVVDSSAATGELIVPEASDRSALTRPGGEPGAERGEDGVTAPGARGGCCCGFSEPEGGIQDREGRALELNAARILR